MRIGEEANFNVEITPQAPIGVVIGDNAKMDVQKAITYVESGKKEIEKAVEDGKADFDDHAADKTQDFDDNAVNKTNAFNQNAVNKTQAFDDNAAIKQAAVDASAAEAKQWAIGDPSEPDGYSSKYWAGQAHAELSDLQNDVSAIQDVIPSDASETNKLTDKDYVDTALALKANASNTVTTDTNQTITGYKTIQNDIIFTGDTERTVKLKNTTADALTAPSSTLYTGTISTRDKNDKQITNIRSALLTNGSQLSYNVRNYSEGGKHIQSLFRATTYSDGGGDMTFAVNNNGSGDTRTPVNRCLSSSTASTTETRLACQGWVNNSATASNVVHRDGTETITGNKNFTGDLTAVTQTAGDNSTKVATTAYVGNKFQVVASLPATPDADTFYFIEES